MEYYSTIKRNEELIRAIMWLNLENAMAVKEARLKRPHAVSPSI